MRTVSFVEHLEFEYQGNIFSKALAVGDVDNDKGNELVIGNILGDLQIHKGSTTKPWRKCSDLGMITCVEIGDICNHGRNYVVSMNEEGWCHIFAVKPDPSPPLVATQSLPTQENNQGGDEDYQLLKYVHKQHLAANSKVMIIADIDEDGYAELVVGYSDRRVRSYRWLDAGSMDVAAGQLAGKFVLIENWQLAGQLGSITVNKCNDGSVDLMVSQPGGTFVTLISTNSSSKRKLDEAAESTDGLLLEGPSLVYHPLGTARARNPGVTTEVVGNISRRKKGEETYVPSYCAICTLDGTLTLVDDDKILWSLYVDHQLFTLTKLDVTGDGTEEVVACSWDGQTYIVNLSRDVVRFQFEENVAAFCAGYYAVSGSENVPCLIYVTFNNRILVYYNIQMSEIGLSNLIETMQGQEEVQQLLSYFSVDGTNPSQTRQLYHWCLYGARHKLDKAT